MLTRLSGSVLRRTQTLADLGRSFSEHQGSLRAAALTYTTILSLVPFLAIAFSVLKGLGVQNALEPLLLQVAGESSRETVQRIVDYVNNTNVKSLGMIGLLMLMVTVLSLLSTIEEAFNTTWGVKESRPLSRRFSDYLSVVVVGPLLLVVALSMTTTLQSQWLVQWLIHKTVLGEAVVALFRLVPYISIWCALTFLYVFIPNVQVRFRSAVLGGVVAGTIWQIAQWGYFHFQVGVAGYNAIYGTLAALPIFLVWVYTSWLIVLFGLEVVKAHHGSHPVYRPPRRAPSVYANKRLPSRRIRRAAQRIVVRLVPLALTAALWCALPGMVGTADAARASISVVMDDNYPPFVFRSPDGTLQGILVDQWRLWEQKTGVRVVLHATDWGRAQQRMQKGEFDLIDTIFKTEERARIYSFSAPYQKIEQPIYFESSIAGIKGLSSVQGFTVAVKEGGAIIDHLRAHGVNSLEIYPSYEAIIRAAKAGTVSVFAVDQPPARYFLHKYGIAGRFKHSAPIRTGYFHRAVLKGNETLLEQVENGFRQITDKEYRQIEQTWYGSSESNTWLARWWLVVVALIAAPVAVLLLWNWSLRRMVTRRTEQLQQSEELYRELVQQAGSIILRWNREGVLTFVNEYGLHYFGFTAEELVGRNVCDTIVPQWQEDGANLREMMGQIFENPAAFRDNINQNIRKGGERVWIAWSNQPISDESGRVLEMLSIGADITGRKAAEEALSHSEERFRLFMQHFPGLAFLKDVDLRVVFANDGFERYLGIPPGEMLGKNNYELFPAEFAEKISVDDRALLATGQPLRVEEQYGGRTWITYKFLLPQEGDAPLVGGFNLDISDLKRVERELDEARREAESANEAKSLFLANMSHEIRTPLNAIIGINSIMLERLASGELRDLIKDSSFAANNLLDIISDVLDISKIEAGKLSIVAIPFELRLLVTQLERMFGMLAREKGLQLIVSMTSGLPDWLQGDPARIQQIGVNLLSNAIKFTEQGTIELAVDGTVCDDGDLVLSLRVKDSGKGIAPENLERIFCPFVQEDLTTTRRYGGTGLGLAISRQLAAMMGGGIEVVSQLGEGSTFTCTVRCQTSVRPEPKETPVMSNRAQHTLRILVAEDSLVNTKMMEAILRMERHRARFVENGCEAVAAWREETFDLILMDIQMPEMDGVQATQEIRRLEAERGNGRTPIIALTAYAMSGDRERFLAGGMDGYLAKPITVDQLREVLSRHGRGEESCGA